jgi:extradiol dioxygenase family protein
LIYRRHLYDIGAFFAECLGCSEGRSGKTNKLVDVHGGPITVDLEVKDVAAVYQTCPSTTSRTGLYDVEGYISNQRHI